MNRKEILEKLEDLAKQAGELQDSLDIAACLRVFILGATKEDNFRRSSPQISAAMLPACHARRIDDDD
jgi:hypothetical protein